MNGRGQKITGLFAAGLLACSAGCQAWSANTFPMQNISRVPPPATGSYPGSGNYYGGNASLAPAGGVGLAGGLAPVSPNRNGGLPSTDLTPPVIPASFSSSSGNTWTSAGATANSASGELAPQQSNSSARSTDRPTVALAQEPVLHWR